MSRILIDEHLNLTVPGGRTLLTVPQALGIASTLTRAAFRRAALDGLDESTALPPLAVAQLPEVKS